MSGGAGAIGGITITAASGIEIALWDLAGRILQTPVCNLLGGRFRDRVRFYRTLQAPPYIPPKSPLGATRPPKQKATTSMASPPSNSKETASPSVRTRRTLNRAT